MTDNFQEHRAVLDLGGDTTRKRGCGVELPCGAAGTLQLAAGLYASDARTD